MTATLTTLYSYAQTGPFGDFIGDGDLVVDSSGDVFGNTTNGGANGVGTVFELVNSASGYALSTLYNFTGGNGFGPIGGLIADANGDLFGATSSGGAHVLYGAVFELDKTASGYNYSPLYSFTGGADGGLPLSDLIADANGDLFGMSTVGGANGGGTVFELVKTASGYNFSVVWSLTSSGPLGSEPIGKLAIDAGGDLFGETTGSGAGGHGEVFELVKTASGYSYSTLVTFNGANGDSPNGGLIADANGDLFGVTVAGGANGDGTVFELVKSASGYTLSTVYSFTGGADGGVPKGGLIADANGDLFGVTGNGGANGDGTVFELVKSASGYTLSTVYMYKF